MKYFYSLFKLFLTFCGFAISIAMQAQSPTTVTNSSTCAVVQDFNTNNGNFTSPSIYSGQFDYQFFYTGPGPNGMLARPTPPASFETSLISPIYNNQSADSSVIIGFSYSAPAGTLYRIRVIRPNVGTGTADILAINQEGPPVLGNGTPNWPAFPADSGTLCLLFKDADLKFGEGYRYEITYYTTSTSSPISFDNFALTSIVPAPLPLPVTFMGIVATREKNNVTLRWDVGTEIHVKQYDIEKSADGSIFSTVGSVAAEQKQVYSFTEANAGSGILFYRVKSVDFDGSVKYSGIVKLVAASSYSNSIRVYPSPAQSQVTLAHNRLSAKAKITLSTMDGRVIKAVVPSFGASNTMIDISNLSSGMYILRLDDGTGKIETTTFVKQ